MMRLTFGGGTGIEYRIRYCRKGVNSTDASIDWRCKCSRNAFNPESWAYDFCSRVQSGAIGVYAPVVQNMRDMNYLFWIQ